MCYIWSCFCLRMYLEFYGCCFIVVFGFLSDHIIMQVYHINASNMFTKKYRKICQKSC